MLPKKNKLDRVQFAKFVGLNPLSVFNRGGTLKYLPQGDLFSVVVSSKHCRRAVARNRAKRRAYSVFQALKKEYIAPLSGILYLSKHAYLLPFSEFETLLKDLFRRAHANSK